MSEQGYIVEIVEGGPWLAQDLSVTSEYGDRGVWDTEGAAQQAIFDSLKQ